MFLFGFAKKAKADLAPDELVDLVQIGATWIAAGNDVIAAAIEAGTLKRWTVAKKPNADLTGKARLRAAIVEMKRDQHALGLGSDDALEQTTLRMLGRDAIPKGAATIPR